MDSQAPEALLEGSPLSVRQPRVCACLRVTVGYDDGLSEDEDICNCCSARIAAEKKLLEFTDPSKLHPAFLGKWTAHHSSMCITPTVVHMAGDSPSLIERLAPYTFTLHHKWGSSIFTLLPSLNQILEVNSKNGNTHYWVKVEG